MSCTEIWDSREFSRKIDLIFDSFKDKLNLFARNPSYDSILECTRRTNFPDYDAKEDDCDSDDKPQGILGHLGHGESTSSLGSIKPGIGHDDGALITNAPKARFKKFFRGKKRLGFYPPGPDVQQASLGHFSLKDLDGAGDEYFRSYLTSRQLNADNSHHVFKVLIQMEDICSILTYRPLAQQDVVVHADAATPGEYWIELKDASTADEVLTPYMDEVVLVPKASASRRLLAAGESESEVDFMLPHADEKSPDPELRRHVATVVDVSKTQVHFRFRPKEVVPSRLSGSGRTKYDILFRPQRLPMRYQHRALELLAESADVRSHLFPTRNPAKELFDCELNLINEDIASNPEQLQAVRQILKSPMSNAPYVIFGPPGTGKTTTVVESIIQLRLHRPGSRILVTAGSNSACDTIALRICRYFNSSPQLRPSHRLHVIRIFAKSVEQKGLHLLDKDLLEHSNCKSGVHVYPAVSEIRKYDIIVATLSTVGKLVTGDVGAGDYFTHIFIDEAGASTEPETLVGIMGTKSPNCSLILCGDHKQLGPVLRCERAAELGLDVSMMERLLNSPCYAVDANGNYDRSLQTRLCRNYRSHPAIVGLYNRLYYNDELVANADYAATHLASNWHILPNSKFPIIFQAVHGTTAKVEGSSSSCNTLEIQVLMWYLQRLLVDGIDGKPVQQQDIGVIAPYRLQYKRIQSQLSRRGWDAVDVGSVETFQGREKPIILVSFVRSFAGLGFIKSPRRLNVLLSRAKSLLILVGNPVTLRRNRDFKFLIEECRRNETFLRKSKRIHLGPRSAKAKIKNASTEKTIDTCEVAEEEKVASEKRKDTGKKMAVDVGLDSAAIGKKNKQAVHPMLNDVEHTSTPILNTSATHGKHSCASDDLDISGSHTDLSDDDLEVIDAADNDKKIRVTDIGHRKQDSNDGGYDSPISTRSIRNNTSLSKGPINTSLVRRNSSAELLQNNEEETQVKINKENIRNLSNLCDREDDIKLSSHSLIWRIKHKDSGMVERIQSLQRIVRPSGKYTTKVVKWKKTPIAFAIGSWSV